jgi:small conductance mechanosensitive channel
VRQLLGQAGLPEGLCLRTEDGGTDLLCELLYRATGNEVVARLAGTLSTVLRIAVVVLVAVVLSRLVGRLISRFANRMERRIVDRLARAEQRGAISSAARYRTRRSQRLKAITGVLRGVAGVAIWLIAILVVVIDVLGLRLQPVLAGAGLVSIIIGFGAQQLVRDVLAGIAMLVEDQYGVGDWIQLGDTFGEVERVGLRSTAFRDLDGIVWHVLNGDVQRVGNLSQHWSRSTLDVPVALDTDVATAKAVIYKVASDLAEDEVWGDDIIGDPEIWGVQELGPLGLKIRVVVPTRPMANWDINRQLRERIKFAFDRAGIRMPGALVEVTGAADGHPLAHRADVEERRPAARSRRGPVPTDVGPLDQPPGAAPGDTAVSRDHTAELRAERGREPRPD